MGENLFDKNITMEEVNLLNAMAIGVATSLLAYLSLRGYMRANGLIDQLDAERKAIMDKIAEERKKSEALPWKEAPYTESVPRSPEFAEAEAKGLNPWTGKPW